MQIIAPVFHSTAPVSEAVERMAAVVMFRAVMAEEHPKGQWHTPKEMSGNGGRRRNPRCDEIYQLYLDGLGHGAIAERIGVTRRYVSDVVRRRRRYEAKRKAA